jgi:hypothetical protein
VAAPEPPPPPPPPPPPEPVAAPAAVPEPEAPTPPPTPEIDIPAAADAVQAAAPAVDAVKEAAPTVELPLPDDADALPAIAGADGPPDAGSPVVPLDVPDPPAPDDSALSPLLDTVTGATTSADDTLAAATGIAPLDDAVATATDDTGLGALDDTIAAITADLDRAPLGDTVAAVAAVTDDGGLGGLGSLTHTVGDVAGVAPLDAVSEGLIDAPSALVTTVDSAMAPQLDVSVAQIGAPLTTTVDALDTPLSDTVAAVTAPFVLTVPPAVPSRSPAIDGDGAAAAPAGGPAPDGSVAPGTHALVDGAAVSAAPVTTAPGADLSVEPGSVFGSALPGAAADPVLRLDVAAPTAASGPAIDQPGALSDAPSVLSPPVAPDASLIADAGTADPLSPADSALAAIADVAPDARILVSAAILTAAVAAMLGPRPGGSGTDVSMVFTNVRLLPCVVKEGLARHIRMLVEAGATVGGPGASAPSIAVAEPGSASGALGVSGERPSDPTARVRNAFEMIRNGFDQAIGEAGDDVGEGFRDSRLMMQIGMLLGCVYVAFLSVWFWATRLRGTDRREAT